MITIVLYANIKNSNQCRSVHKMINLYTHFILNKHTKTSTYPTFNISLIIFKLISFIEY